MFKLRENFTIQEVEVYKNDQLIHSNSEYSGAIRYLKNKYNLSEDELMALYRPYKDDYDRRMR